MSVSSFVCGRLLGAFRWWDVGCSGFLLVGSMSLPWCLGLDLEAFGGEGNVGVSVEVSGLYRWQVVSFLKCEDSV